MNRLMLAGAALAALASGPAFAQSFEGPYVGAQAGWNHDIAIHDDKDAAVGGVFVGYDHHVTPNVVLGGSHSGNIAAIDLLRIGHAEILSSDYVPASLMESLFKLPASDVGIALP